MTANPPQPIAILCIGKHASDAGKTDFVLSQAAYIVSGLGSSLSASTDEAGA